MYNSFPSKKQKQFKSHVKAEENFSFFLSVSYFCFRREMSCTLRIWEVRTNSLRILGNQDPKKKKRNSCFFFFLRKNDII